MHDFSHRLHILSYLIVSYLLFHSFFSVFSLIFYKELPQHYFRSLEKVIRLKGLKIGYRCIIEVLFNLFKGTQVKNPVAYYSVDLSNVQISPQVVITELTISKIYCVLGLSRSCPLPFNLLSLKHFAEALWGLKGVSLKCSG